MMRPRPKARRSMHASSVTAHWMRWFMVSASFSLFALMILTTYLSPLAYMLVTGFKSKDMLSKADAPLWPAQPAIFTYEGQEYDIYSVPTQDGQVHEWALFKKGREESLFLDPENPEAGPVQWTGRWRMLNQVWSFSLRWENFSRVDWHRTLVCCRGVWVLALPHSR
jgi:multiple sugar transport system permease protein